MKTSVDREDSFNTPQRVGVTGHETDSERTEFRKTSFLSSSSDSARRRLQFSSPKRVQFRENNYTPYGRSSAPCRIQGSSSIQDHEVRDRTARRHQDAVHRRTPDEERTATRGTVLHAAAFSSCSSRSEGETADEERRRLITAGFRSRQEFVGIRRALLRVEDEENHQRTLLFAEFASSSLTMAVKFALQCSRSLTEGCVSLSTRTNTQSRVLDAENAVREQGARMQATEERLQHMELSSARRSQTENETSGTPERKSTKQAVESLTTIVDDLVRRTTSERLGSVEKELQRLRVCQDEIQKTYDKVLKEFQDQGPERHCWRTRRHQGVYAQPWRDGSQYYDQWRYGPGRYPQQRKGRQCYVGNTFHRQWTRKECAEPEEGNEMFSKRPWSEHKRGKRAGRRQRLGDALKVLLEALFDFSYRFSNCHTWVATV